MVENLLAWLVAPALLWLLIYGLGLLLSLIIKKPMSMAINLATGFCLVVILGSIFTIAPTMAPYAAIIIGALSLLGIIVTGVGFRSYLRMDYPAALAGLITYVVFGLPLMMYGSPSWAGWVQLDDTATWFAATDRLMAAGHSVPNVISSTYERLIDVVFGGNVLNYGGVANTHFDYPTGSFIPYGVVSKLTGIEKAWIFQPYLSFAASVSAILIVLFFRRHLKNKFKLVGLAVLSMMASTIYSYVMWGGIKEIVLIVPLLLFSYSVFIAIQGKSKREFYLYSIIGILALYFIGGATSLGFVAPILLIACLVKVCAKSVVAFYSALVTAIVFPVVGLFALRSGNNAIGRLFVPEIKDSGNLSRPLNLMQMMGIWPSKDFRLDPLFPQVTYFVIIVAFCYFALGIFYSVKKQLWVVPALVAACTCVVAYSYLFAGIWITGKAIAVASPIFLMTAAIGAIELWKRIDRDIRIPIVNFQARYLVAILAAMVGSGVVVSDFYTYRNVWIAPYSQMNELETIGKLYSGQGPALMTEYSVFGARYFLRNLDAESASELRVHPIPMSDGSQVPKGFAADISLFDPNTINYYKLLVLRKSPVSSRPPLNYQLIWSGEHYEVWKRMDSAPMIKKMLSLGNNFSPGSIPTCSEVTTFLSDRAKGEKIYAVVRNKTYLISFSNGDLPSGWIPTSTYSGAVNRTGTGGFSRTFSVDQTGFYDLSLAGSFPGRLRLLIDGDQIFSGHSVFEGNPTLTNTLTRVHIAAGQHILTLIYTSPILMSGSDVAARFGPIFLSTQFAGDAKVKQISISRIPQLCTENLDWITITN